MATIGNKARRIFAPLDISVSVVCASGDSPFMQTTDGTTYYPDRTQSGYECKAYPQVHAAATDGSWNAKQSNIALTNMVWKVFSQVDGSWQWKKISELTEWSGKYEIDTTSSTTRGTLTIKRNLGSNQKQQLRFEADLYDHRTGSLTSIVTESITLYTVDKGEDMYGIGIGESTHISNNPFIDKLALYDYKVANGLIAASDTARAACFDGQQYEQTIPINVYKGTNAVTSGYTIELYRINNGTKTRIYPSTTAAPNEIMSLSLTALKIDMRMVEKTDYLIRLMVNNTAVAQVQFSAARFYPPIRQPEFFNQSEIKWGELERKNKVIFTHNHKVVEYPGRLMKIAWSTSAYSNGTEQTTKQWQEGEKCEYAIQNTGLGFTEQDWLEESVEYEQKNACEVLTDGDGTVLTDENGNILID